MTKKGGPHCNLHNIATILEKDPTLQSLVKYDEFLQRVVTKNSPVREWKDEDDLAIVRYIQSDLAMSGVGRDVTAQAIYYIACKNKINCVRDWADSLQWDNTPRVDAFFSDAFGADESEYTRSASRNFWLSMVARVYKPGCKVDNMVVLEGAQGVGKSTAMQIIGGDWFAEQHESATNPKAFAEILQGKLLIEISEMDAFSRVEVNRVKQTVSCPSDRFRDSYGRHAADHPRTCIFVGTTNRDDWNRDETGARRFWPIVCRSIDLDLVQECREQLFAEAVSRHKSGEPHWLMPQEPTRHEQESRYQADPWLDAIAQAIKGEPWTTTAAISQKLDIPLERRNRATEMRIGSSLLFLRWGKKRERVGTDLMWVYRPKDGTVGTDGTK